MSISDTKAAQKYASIAEVAAAQAKEVLTEALLAPEYAGQAAASAEEAANAAQQAQDAAGNAASNVTEQINDQLAEQKEEFDTEQQERKTQYASAIQNLIPLSRQYMTLPAAQEDIANIPVGSVTYVRSQDGDSLADEYMNISGALVATGKKMASQEVITQATESLAHEISTRDSAIRLLNENNGYYFLIPDENGREVFGLDSINGAPKDHTMDVWFRKMSQTKSLPALRNIPGYGLVYILPDSAGDERLTELAVRSSDGAFPDWVLSRWADRLAPMLAGKIDTASQRPSLAGTWKHPGGDYVPYSIDLRTIVGLGSSSTNRSNAAYTSMATELGSAYVNLGDEGASIQQNAAQIGAVPALLTVSGGIIPASGTVNVTASNMPLNSNMNAFSGTLAGIPGVFAWSTGSTGAFTRSSTGSAVAVTANTPFMPNYSQYRANCIILESGKNDINTSRTAALILADTLAIANWFAPFIPRTVVMGHFANGSYTAGQRQILSAVNAGINSNFGNRAIDQQAWLTSPGIWAQLSADGVTPTAEDLADQANGDVPRQLMTSARDHLTPASYGYRMKYLVKPKLIELGLYKG